VGVRKESPALVKRVDARVERTRKALTRAFVALFFERPYGRISVNAVAARAGVGRSTFYEHYVDKEDILAATVRAPMAGLAAAASGGNVEAMRQSLAHFRANAAQGRALFLGDARRPLARVLAAMVREELGSEDRDVKVVAIAIAEAQIGAIGAWLFGEMDQTVEELASILHRITRAAVATSRGERGAHK
jgi:AcrR family transcriptional regulator